MRTALASGAVQSTTYQNPPEKSSLHRNTQLRGVGAGVGSTVGSTVGTGVGSTVGATVCTGVGGAKTCARCHFPYTYCTLQPRRPCQPPFTMCPVCGSRNGASNQCQMTISGATQRTPSPTCNPSMIATRSKSTPVRPVDALGSRRMLIHRRTACTALGRAWRLAPR